MNNLLSHLRIADLELFITAGHLKNLGKAASLHNLSQSAASAAIARVEQAFGQALCTHEKRHFRLTHQGASLIPAAEDWLRHFREKVATNLPRPLRLATTQAIARAVISAILPIETIELKLMRPDRAFDAVLNDTADIALVPDNSPWSGTTVRNKVARSSVWEERPLFARVDVYQNFNSYQDRPHVQTYFIFRTFETYSSQFRVGSRS
jgi:DNA-binding transcriptional LysR family regulator